MKLNTQKKIAAEILGCSPSRVLLDETKLEEIKEEVKKKSKRLRKIRKKPKTKLKLLKRQQ